MAHEGWSLLGAKRTRRCFAPLVRWDATSRLPRVSLLRGACQVLPRRCPGWSFGSRQRATNQKTCHLRGAFSNAGGGTRTPDKRIMIHATRTFRDAMTCGLRSHTPLEPEAGAQVHRKENRFASAASSSATNRRSALGASTTVEATCALWILDHRRGQDPLRLRVKGKSGTYARFVQSRYSRSPAGSRIRSAGAVGAAHEPIAHLARRLGIHAVRLVPSHRARRVPLADVHQRGPVAVADDRDGEVRRRETGVQLPLAVAVGAGPLDVRPIVAQKASTSPSDSSCRCAFPP